MRRMSLKRKLPVLLLVILVLGLSLHTGKSIQAASDTAIGGREFRIQIDVCTEYKGENKSDTV